jgi:type IV pilus assembly protein PilA
MNKTLLVLIFIGVFLAWKFVLFPEKLDFTDKVKVLQGLAMAKAHKTAIAKYWEEKKMFPTAEQWAAEGPKVDVNFGSSIVAAIEVAEVAPGSVTVYYSNARDQSLAAGISGKSLSLTPSISKGLVEWSCKGTVPVEYLPRLCK